MVFTIAASPVLHDVDVSFETISLGFGLLYSILAIAEIPTGAWADLFGSRKSAIIGGLIQTLSLVLLSIGPADKAQILAAFALYGLGSSFVSGALSALLYGNAKGDDGDGFNSNRYFSSIEKVAVASYVLASMSVGFLSEWFSRGAFFVGGAVYLVASIFIAVAVNELPPEREYHSARKEFFSRIREGFAGIRASTQLMALMPIRILHQVETILGVLWLPWIQRLGGGNAIWISVLSTGSYVLRYVVNHYFSDKPRPHSYLPRLSYALTCMALGTLICAFAENLWMALFGVWTMAGARGAFLPAAQAIQHEEFPERVRTTGISAINFSTESIFAVSYFVSAPFIDKISVPVAWSISCACFLLASSIGVGVRQALDRSRT